MDTILSLLEVAERLYSVCQTVQDNKDQCGRLGESVASLRQVLEGLQKNQNQDPSRRAPDLDTRLAQLRVCFGDAEALVTRYGSTGRLGRVFKAKAMEEEFQKVFKRLDELQRLLSLSLQVEQRGQVHAVHDTVDRSEQKIDSLHEKMDKLFQEKEKQGSGTPSPAASIQDAGPGSPSPAVSTQDADKLLTAVRSRFVEKATLPLLKQLLDDLQEGRVLNSEEAESVLEEQSARADRARCLIDIVRKKGRKASEKMITHLRDRDPSLAETLGLA